MTVAIFDGNCVICNTTRRVVQFLDWFNRVEFLDLHDATTLTEHYPQVDPDDAMGQIHVVADQGTVYAGFQGTRRMLRDLPLLWPLWVILHLPIIGNWLGPRVYGFVAANRYSINRLLGVDLEQIEREEAACEGNVCKIPERS